MSLKRKAAAAATQVDEESASKKRKSSGKNDNVANIQIISDGLELLASLKQAKDKRSKLIAEDFLVLPDKKALPDYYKSIPLPMAIDTIEKKLKNGQYSTMTGLESDLKRMVVNAKWYNEKNSTVWLDAEKIRKFVTTWMKDHNPAYKDPSYSSQPTPNPGEEPLANGGDEDEAEEPIVKDEKAATPTAPTIKFRKPSVKQEAADSGTEQSKKTSGIKLKVGKAQPPPEPVKPTAEMEQAAKNAPALNASFQEAQDTLVTELLDLQNKTGENISFPFHNLPNRELRDYYHVVKNPMSLRGIQKKVRGIVGREKPTNVSLYTTWESFDADVTKIFANARLYNEDGSDISKLVDLVEAYYQTRFATVKEAVPAPKIKLTVQAAPEEESIPKIKIATGAKTEQSSTNGVRIDAEALRRQKELVSAATGGPRQTPNLQAESSGGVKNEAQPSPAISGLKTEASGKDSPAPSLPPPIHQTRSHSESGNANANASTPAAVPTPSPAPQSTPTPVQSSSASNANGAPVNPLDVMLRASGKSVDDAILQNVMLQTHPGLLVDAASRFELNIPASPVLTQQSLSFNVPAEQYMIRVTPRLSPDIATRSCRVFVLVNGNKTTPITGNSDRFESRTPVFDARVGVGLNRIDVEVIAGPHPSRLGMRPPTASARGLEVDFEKVTAFVNVFPNPTAMAA